MFRLGFGTTNRWCPGNWEDSQSGYQIHIDQPARVLGSLKKLPLNIGTRVSLTANFSLWNEENQSEALCPSPYLIKWTPTFLLDELPHALT